MIVSPVYYTRNIYKWLPNPEGGLADEKKLLGLAIEKEGTSMFALSSKCYTIATAKGQAIKNRGISGKEGEMTSRALMDRGIDVEPSALCSDDYSTVVKKQLAGEECVLRSTSLNLRVFRGVMSKIRTSKNALTGVHTKMVLLKNQSCAPFIHGLDARTGYRVERTIVVAQDDHTTDSSEN